MNRYQRAIKKLLIKRDGEICAICGEFLTEEEATVDHIMPITKGGLDEYDNFQLAHRACNTGKGNRILSGFLPRPKLGQSKMIRVTVGTNNQEEHVLKAFAKQEERSVTNIIRELIRSLEPKIRKDGEQK